MSRPLLGVEYQHGPTRAGCPAHGPGALCGGTHNTSTWDRDADRASAQYETWVDHVAALYQRTTGRDISELDPPIPDGDQWPIPDYDPSTSLAARLDALYRQGCTPRRAVDLIGRNPS